MQLLLVFEQLWIDIIIDFVLKLPKCYISSQLYNVILIVIDQLLKKKHYIFCSNKNKNTFTAAMFDLFLQHILSEHRLPISLTLDKKPQFVSEM